MIVEGQNLSMVRGDSEAITVTMRKDDETVPFTTGDTVYFTVKASPKLPDIALQKIVVDFTQDGAARIELKPEDTKKLTPRQYWYDIQYTSAAGDVKTIVGKSMFTLREEVTCE